jgi:hypothetical protein
MLAAVAPAFFAQPALAYGPSSYVTDGVTDLTFPDFMEGLIQWKAVQTGVSTASESSAMTAALDVGMGSLVESAEAGAVGLAAVGTPVGWLALLGIAGGAGTYCIVEGCTSPLWTQEATSPVTFGEPVPAGANITAGQPLYTATGGTNQSKTQTCKGSDPDETIAECVAWMNGADTTTNYTAAAANAAGTAILTEFSKTTNAKTGTVSITASTSGNSSYSCSSPAALTVTSSGCTYRAGRPIHAKTYGSVLHAILWEEGSGPVRTVRKALSAPDACIARNVIPRVRSPICCVQYAAAIQDMASNVHCTP